MKHAIFIHDTAMRMAAVVLICVVCSPMYLLAQDYGPVVPLEPSPGWRGAMTGASCGGAADINGDGAMDLIITYGNGDHSIYYNTGSGPASMPGWQIQGTQGTNTDMVLTADLQGDGYPELIFLKENQAHDIPAYLVYPNSSGVPGTIPVWQSRVHFSYGGDTGDIDGDGIPDLYVACYDGPDVVYRGLASGVFEDPPVWTAEDHRGSSDADLLDMDADGDLDAVICAMGEATLRIHANTGGVLSTMPIWECSTDIKAMYVHGADANGDGYPELAVSTWTTAAAVFRNNAGTPDPVPVWMGLPGSDLLEKYYWSRLAWSDVNGDGYPDIAAGHWWWTPSGFGGDRIRIYLNNQGTLEENPAWISATVRPVRDLGFADLTANGCPDLWAAVDDAPELYASTLPDWGGLGVSLHMPARKFAPGEICSLYLDIHCPGGPRPGTPVFVLLELAGSFWCAPGWTPLDQVPDYYLLDLISGPSRLQVLPEFKWPDMGGSMNGLCVYGAMVSPDMSGILGCMDLWYFGYSR